MSGNDVTIRVGSEDNSGPDLDSLKARLDELGHKAETAKVSVDSKEGQHQLDLVNAKLAQVGARLAKPNVSVAGAARAEADLSGIDLSLDKIGDKSVKPKVDSSDIEHGSTMTGLLLTGAASIAPAFAVAGIGAAAFGALAIPTLQQAEKGTGPLAAGIKGLKGEYDDLAKSVQPEVVRDFSDAVGEADKILPEFKGAAQAGGEGVDDLVKSLGAFMQSSDTKNFLAFISKEAGPDMEAAGQAATGLGTGVEGIVQALNPLAQILLPVVGDLGKFVGIISTDAPTLVRFSVVAAGVAFGINKIVSAGKAIAESSVGSSLINWGKGIASVTQDLGDATKAEKALFVAEAAVDSISPFAWAAGAAVAVGALVYATRNVASATQDAVTQINKENNAAGSNIAGYQKASKALNDLADQNQNVKSSTADTEVGFARAGQAMQAAASRAKDYSAAADDDTKKANSLTDALVRQAQQDSITVQQESQVQKAMDVLGSSTANTQQKVNALTTAWNILVGNFASKEQAILGARQAVQQFGEDVKKDGADSLTSKQQFEQAVVAIGDMTVAMQKSHSPASTLYKDLENQITALRNSGTPNKEETQQLKDMQSAADKLAQTTDNMTQKQRTAASVMESKMTPDLKAMTNASEKTKSDLDKLVDSIVNTGSKSSSTHAARAQLIRDLENSGEDAADAKKDVDKYITSIKNVPHSAKTTFTLDASGKLNLTEKIIGSLGGSTGVGVVLNSARGRRVTGGTPGKDSVLVRAMPDELILPAAASDDPRAIALAAAYGVPGYSSGGLVGSYGGKYGLTGMYNWFAGNWNATHKGLSVGTAGAGYNTESYIAKKLLANQAPVGGGGGPAPLPGGGDPAKNAALARKMMPSWGSGVAWTDWNNVAMRESGWSQFAQNSSSGAYGIPQALPYTKMPRAAWPASAGGSSDPGSQISWMVGYIKGRYGNPQGAWAHELSNGWYGSGGATSAGISGINDKGPELVRLPSGSTVVPSGMSQQLMSGMGAPVHVHLDFGSGSESGLLAYMVKALRKEIRVTTGGDAQAFFRRSN